VQTPGRGIYLVRIAYADLDLQQVVGFTRSEDCLTTGTFYKAYYEETPI
jgi:hypothetical protein